jgi:RHS repeat-associated protein
MYTYGVTDQLTAGADVFTYNTARQTMSATVAGVAPVFAYDGNGNRSSVTTGGVVTSEVWDTQGGLPSLVAQRDAAGVVSRRYTYVGSSPVKFEEGATLGYYLTDGLGSVSNMTTTTGAVGATYRYGPYGTARAATSVLPAFASNPMRYTGQQLDPTGNYNLRARHYNPGRGAFTQTDPLNCGAGCAAESAYAYVGNRPTVMVDPSGERGVGVGLGGERLVPENPVGDPAPDQLALVLAASGTKLPAKGCLPGDDVGVFYDGASASFGRRKVLKKVFLCGGVQKSKGSYGLAHINAQGHFGGKLGTSPYAQWQVATTIDEGAPGDYKGGGLVTNWSLPFACKTQSKKKVTIHYIWDVTVSADQGDRIITAFIAKDDQLDKADPERMKAACRNGGKRP